MSVTLSFTIDAKCNGCAHAFQLPLNVRKVSTGGELEVLRLNPTGNQLMDFVELGSLPEVCPNCGEPVE